CFVVRYPPPELAAIPGRRSGATRSRLQRRGQPRTPTAADDLSGVLLRGVRDHAVELATVGPKSKDSGMERGPGRCCGVEPAPGRLERCARIHWIWPPRRRVSRQPISPHLFG